MALLADPANRDQNGGVSLHPTVVTLLLKLMESEDEQKRQLQLIVEELRDLRARITHIEADQLSHT
ncbi:hypothetical protein PTTG_29097 [Puccinia triticina 1-1 BBBD Race 1]|uniref:Uncharacterized protein n=1 Tax=Puccinia triticina (isolate 1-1 / race 1 (BBBD)) TaxID=630390 RepID=A0A180G6X8_PUCT1|nr:hypothetical protein PTTG_29097 [Puccinia triticina 1-1 BBBD Race 1]